MESLTRESRSQRTLPNERINLNTDNTINYGDMDNTTGSFGEEDYNGKAKTPFTPDPNSPEKLQE